MIDTPAMICNNCCALQANRCQVGIGDVTRLEAPITPGVPCTLQGARNGGFFFGVAGVASPNLPNREGKAGRDKQKRDRHPYGRGKQVLSSCCKGCFGDLNRSERRLATDKRHLIAPTTFLVWNSPSRVDILTPFAVSGLGLVDMNGYGRAVSSIMKSGG